MQRFYRGDASRGTPGVGLGLSLVQAVAKLHGSALELRDNGPGLRVVMSIAIEGGGAPGLQAQPEASSSGEPIAPPSLVSLP
jgi:signal transduction histidine kinase